MLCSLPARRCRATDVLCPSVHFLSAPHSGSLPSVSPLGFLRFTDRIPDESRHTIHTENEAAFATSRYKSACKGTTF